MNRRTFVLLTPPLLAACAGIPMGAVPRLFRLQKQLLELDPAELMLAIQLDARLAPRTDAVPVLEIAIRPAEPGAFEPIERKLPMRLDRFTTARSGLRAPTPNREWLVYSLTEGSQAELRQVQLRFQRLRDERAAGRAGRGGSVSIGIAQHGLAPEDPVWAASRWDTWLQTSRAEGFWELWSGTVGELLAQARASAARR